MRGKVSELIANPKVRTRKLIETLNKPDPRKPILKLNYYVFPPENEHLFMGQLLSEAGKRLPLLIDPLWANDKLDDWKTTGFRDFVADFLNYFYLDIEEARYETITHYFETPDEIIRTDMSRSPGTLRKLLGKLRGGT